MDFPLKLRRLMGLRRLSQAEVAEALGVHQTLVSRWARGINVPDIAQARRLADVLGVSLDYLGRDELDEPPEPELGEDERALLVLVRELGPKEARRRLMGLRPSPEPRPEPVPRPAAEAAPNAEPPPAAKGPFVGGAVIDLNPRARPDGAPPDEDVGSCIE